MGRSGMCPYRLRPDRGFFGLIASRGSCGELSPGLGIKRFVRIQGRNPLQEVTVHDGQCFRREATFLFGVELFLDVGTFGPLPEFLLEPIFGPGTLQRDPFPFDVKALGLKIVATETRDIGAKLAQVGPFDLRIGFGRNEGLG